MKRTTQYSVGGEIIDVADDRYDEFMGDAAMDYEEEPEEVYTFWVNGSPVQVKASRVDEFLADCEADGISPRKTQGFVMDDGEQLRLGEEDVRQFVQAREQGMPISRGLLKNTGIPDQYGRSKEEREALADVFAQMYRKDEAEPQREEKAWNLGDEIMGVAEDVAEGVSTSPTVAGAKGFVEGLYEGAVGNPSEAIDEYYGEDSGVGNAIKGANDFSNKLVKKIMSLNPAAKEVVAQALGGEDSDVGRYLRQNAQADREALDEALPTDTAYVDPSLEGANEFVGDTLSTIGTFAIPGAAAVDISANTANAYYDARERALASGMSEAKANAFALAKAGATAAQGVVLGKAARGARSAAGFKGALTDMAVTGGEMGALAGAEDVVEQGIEGKENPDLERTLKNVAEETAKGAAFSGVSRAVHGAAGANDRRMAADERKWADERVEDEVREIKRDAAKERYEANLSDEASNDVDRMVGEMIKAEVIPSWRNAEEVRQKAIEKLGGRENGESHEAVEQAVMEAAQEVQERLQTPERVTSPALERRQTEAQARENERWAKRSDELAEQYGKEEAEKRLADEKAAAERQNAAEEVAQGEHEARQNDLEAAFADMTAEAKPDGKGRVVKPEPKADISDEMREKMTSDETMRDIVERAKTAKTDEERAALQAEFNKRWYELRGEKPEEETAEETKPVEEPKTEPIAEEPANTPQAEAEPAQDARVPDGKGRMVENGVNEKPLPNSKTINIGEGKDAKIEWDENGRTVVTLPDGSTEEFNMNDKGTPSLNAINSIKSAMEYGKGKKTRDAYNKASVEIDEVRKNLTDLQLKLLRDKKSNEKPEEPVVAAFANETNEQLVNHIKNPKGVLKEIALDELKKRGLDENGKPIEKDAEADVRVPDGKGKMVEAPVEEAKVAPASRDKDNVAVNAGVNAQKKIALSQINDMIKAADASMKVPASSSEIDAAAKKYEKLMDKARRAAKDKLFSEEGRCLNDAQKIIDRFAPNEESGSVELKMGTTTFTVKNNPIALRIAKNRIDKIGKAVSKKRTTSTRGPSEIKVASGKNVKGFDDVAGDFVSKAPDRKGMSKPIVQGEYKYASDGRVAFRMKNEDGSKDTKDAYNAKAVFDKNHSSNREHTAEVDVPSVWKSLSSISGVNGNVANSVSVWLQDDGTLAFQRKSMEYGNTEVNSNGDISGFAGKSLKGAEYIGEFNLDYLKNTFKTLGKIGDGKVKIGWDNDFAPLYIGGKRGEFVIAPVRADGRNRVKQSQYKSGERDALDLVSETDVSMRNLEPGLRSDAKVVAWAKKRGRAAPVDPATGKATVSVETMREYNRDRAMKAADMVKRAFPGMKVTYHDKPEGVSRGVHDISLRDKAGRYLGWYRPSDKSVVLLPGSDAETVAHEIGWHAARDWAKEGAAAGDAKRQKLLDAMHDVENNIPSALRTKVLRLYRNQRGYTRDDLLNEFGAWDFMKVGGAELEKAMESRENQKWFAKAVTTMKDVWKDYASAHGGNRVDLSQIDGMTIDQFKDFIAKQLVEGKTFGAVKDPNATIKLTESALDKAKRKVSDINAPLQTIEKRIQKKTGTHINTDDSVADENARKAGYYEAAHMSVKGKISDFKKKLTETGLSQEDVGYYMALKGAAGRDLKVDNRNKANLTAQAHKEALVYIKAEERRLGRPLSTADRDAIIREYETRAVQGYQSTNGSGIDPREARQQIAEIERGDKANEYKECAQMLRDIINETLDSQEKSGLVNRATSAQWRQEEPDYVPYKSAISEENGEYLGRGSDLGGYEHHTAKGRKTAAGDIVGHIFEDYQATLYRSIDNGIRQKLAALVRANPELGTIEKIEPNSVKERKLRDSSKKFDGGEDNVVLFKENGDTMAIRLNGEIGKSAAAAITGRNLTHVWSPIKKTTRFFASLATEHSPTFSVRNFQKDQLALGEIVVAERGVVDGAKWLGHYAASQKDTHAALWKFVTTGKVETNTKGGRILRDFIDNGGMIGGYEKESLGDVSKQLSYDEIQKELKRGNNLGKAIAKHTVKSVSYLNKMSELMSRVNAFEAERRMGKDKDGNAVTDKGAALFSRKALVDFNQAGEHTGITNTYKMFANSALGANVRAVQAAVGNKHGPALLGTMMAFGAAQAAINHFANRDDDEKREKEGRSTGKDVSEYELRNSFAYFRNGEKMYKIGQHEDVFTLASYFGNTITRCCLGEISKEKAAKELGVSVAELASVFTGLGDANFSSESGDVAGLAKAVALYLTPSGAQPIAEIALNQDYAGRKLYKDSIPGDYTPKSERGKKSTPEYANNAAKKLNRLGGGNEAKASWLDVPPEVVQKVVEGFGKNALKDVMNIYETGKAILKGEYGDLDKRLVPVKRDFVKDVPDSSNRYYNLKEKYDKDVFEFEKRRDEMSDEERKQFVAERPWLRKDAKGRRAADKLINGFSSGNGHVPGISDLYKMENGMKRRKGGKFVKHEWTKEQLEDIKTLRLKKQARLIELIGE